MKDRPVYHLGLRREMSEFLPDKPVNVLEIGCGEGAFIECVPHYREYWGVEPDSASVTIAAGRLTHVHAGLYDDIADKLPDSYFDLVICNDVIEHMIDHDAFLREIQRKMTTGGVLVGSIPNVRYFENLKHLFFKRDWQYQNEGILDRTHLRFFTEKSLFRSLQESGFGIEVFKGINAKRKRFFPLKKLLQELVFALIGDDVRYMQFGFRVVNNGQASALPSSSIVNE
jgi:SAM-dependent methyltransferase